MMLPYIISEILNSNEISHLGTVKREVNSVKLFYKEKEHFEKNE